jgi:putative thioredoxin
MSQNQTIIFDTSVERFETEVVDASHRQPVLVDFWADWCPPCVVLTPILDKVVNSLGGKVLLAKVEVDDGDNMRLAGRFGLRGFPTVILLVKGEEVGRFSSARPEAWVREFLSEHADL